MGLGRVERFIRVIVALALLPLCVAATLLCFDMLRGAATVSDSFIIPGASILGGGLVWALAYTFIPLPTRVYILGHELTHALWGLMFGARVSGLRVRASGGSVRLTKTNTLITLAPYFFPFYTIMIAAVWAVASLFVNLAPYVCIFLFLVGLTWCFHVTFTINSLLMRQPDIIECGRLFSYTLIYIMNVAGVALWIMCATPVSGAAFTSSAVTRVKAAYSHTAKLARHATLLFSGH